MIRFTLNPEEAAADPELYTYTGPVGRHAYRRTAVLMLMKAVQEKCGKKARPWVEFSYHGNYFVTIENTVCDDTLAKKLKAAMREYCREAIMVNRVTIPATKAKTAMDSLGGDYGILKYRISSRINYHELDGYYAYFADHLLDNTSYIENFDIVAMNGGLVLTFPERKDFSTLSPAVPSGKLFEVQSQSQHWADELGVSTLADLNGTICEGDSENLILMQEAIFEKRIGDVAAKIAEKGKRFVFLAGPSSSGKTTTAHRLAIQLRAYGLVPQIISADNYFFGKENWSYLPDGSPDFESIRAVDTGLFNSDMIKLLNGETVELPNYNFVLQQREYKGQTITLGEKKVLIVEGIHCLNPIFSEKIPKKDKFLIYVSALTPLCVDSANPIPTSDCRLLRRIARDARTRGYSAAETIMRWASVREGEEENIFPYQENADVILNSAMIYELSVLKTSVEPLLYGIEDTEPEYSEARRLLKFLSFVLAIPTDSIPITSVIREFIGGSYFDV